MKRKLLIILMSILGNILGVFIFVKFLYETDYIYKNYIERWFAKENTVRELSLDYVGMEQVDLKQSKIFSAENNVYSEYVNSWQLLGYGQYRYFKEQIGFNNTLVGIRCSLGDSYIISYGRKLTNATYNLSEYNGFFTAQITSEFSSGGYFVDFTYDETEYYENTVFIYKSDRIVIGNSTYKY